MIENIIQTWNECSKTARSEGRGWYQTANILCQGIADEFGIDHETAVKIVAVLSPRLSWERNIWAARQVLKGSVKVGGALPANVEKALRILEGEDWIRGPKVTAFSKNILGDPNEVTVDTWAWRIWADNWTGKPPTINDKLYATIAADYKAAAEKLGVSPRELQAATWVHVRHVINGRAAPGQLTLDI